MKPSHIISIGEALSFCFDYIKKVKKYIGKLLIISIVSFIPLITTLILPMLMRQGIDTGLLQNNITRFMIIAGLSGLLGIFMVFAQQWRSFYQSLVKNMMALSLKREVLSRLLARDIRYFAQQESSHGINRIMFDTDRITEAIVSLPGEFIELIPRMLLAFGLIFYLDKNIGFFFLFISPIIALPVFFTQAKIQNLYRSLWGYYERIVQEVNDLFSHILLVKAFHKEGFMKRKIMERSVDHLRKSIEIARFEFKLQTVHNLLTKGLVGSLALYACLRVMHNEITIGTLTAVLAYAGQIVTLQGTLSQMLRRLIMTSVSCRRVNEIICFETKECKEKNSISSLLDNNITIKKVSFLYDANMSVFDAISLSIVAGETLAIVGASGCGKTTLAYLIMGLLKPLHGEITIAGKNIAALEASSYLNKVGVVLQEAFLMSASVKENIFFGMTGGTDADIDTTCRICALNDLVNGLSDSYNTLVGENGVRLSAGQRQRIALARAIIRRPELLIIDEGLSAVDSATESSIIKGIRQYLPQSTIIIISHRLATALACDRIIMITSPSDIVTVDPSALHDAPQAFLQLFESQLIK
jgi:ATP-binding cassette, subfamily B, multidrug efflux pump